MVIKLTSKNIIKNNDDLLYSEWVPIGKFVKIIISLVSLFFIFMVVIISALESRIMIFLLLILGGACIFILFMYWNYRGLRITLTKNQIEVKYGIFNYKIILLKNIINCETIKATFRKYGGVGIRLGFDGSIAYNTDFGEAVKLTYLDGKPFAFSTRNPQKICKLIYDLSK